VEHGSFETRAQEFSSKKHKKIISSGNDQGKIPLKGQKKLNITGKIDSAVVMT